MLRLFIIILGMFIILMPSSVFANEDAGKKAQVISLYKSYRASLKEEDNQAALKYAKQMYELTPKVYGKISNPHATAAFNLAQMSELLYIREDAAALYREHIDILDALNVPKDEKYLGKLRLLTKAYMRGDYYKKAAKNGRKELKLAKALNIQDEILAEYELALGIYNYRIYGKAGKAKKRVNKAIKLFSASYGEHHIKTAKALFWRAKLSMGLNKNRKAAEEFENVLEIYNENLDPGHGSILQTHAFLVNTYEKLGEKEKSTEHCIAVAKERPVGFEREIEPLYKVIPVYPHSAERSQSEGYIIAEFIVDEFGQVKDIKTLEGENVKTFEKAAHEALSKFRYAPSIKDGERVKTEGVLHKVTFKMERR